MEQEKRTLQAFSYLFLLLAVVNLILLIIPIAQGEFSVAALMEQVKLQTPDVPDSVENLTRILLIVAISIAAISILMLVYMGYMGLRQYQGKPTGTSHITIAKICFVVMIIASISAFLSAVNGPLKSWDNWVGLLTNLCSVLITGMYIKAAKSLKAE